LTVLVPPTITLQPQPQSARPGSNVTFTVAAVGSAPLRFQWCFNGSELAGATNTTLVLSSVQPSQDGYYSVFVTDPVGAVSSSAVRLTVLVAPGIAQQPWPQATVAGGNATFTVIVSNNATLPLGYRWRRGGATVAFQTLTQYVSHLVVSNVQTSAVYNVVLTNSANTVGVLSASAALTVLADSDNDGLPDVWESFYGLNPTNAADRLLDSDGDGLSNW